VTNHIQARDDCARLFTERFEALNPDVEIRYQGVLFALNKALLPVDPSKYWVRFSMRSVMSRQAAFVMSDDAEQSPIAYETNGLLFVQVFAPMSAVDGFRKGGLLAQDAQAIFRRAETPAGVVFRNARINELEDDTKSFRWNVIAEYEFDETIRD
jgi:hypothetical protein